MAYWEEWKADFWNISEEKRCEIFSVCEQREQDVYRTYFEKRDLRLKAITSDSLIKEIRYFAKANGIEENEMEQYTEMVRDAVCIELGGNYAGDFSYLAIQGDTLIFIDCGVWD